MPMRFRKSIKVGGVRFNVSKSGVSTTVGKKGGSITFGKRGTSANVGLPGTGLAYHSRLGSRSSAAPSKPHSSEAGTVKIPLKVIADDDGNVRWVDENDQPLSEALIAVARRQNRPVIVQMLERQCETINGKIERLVNFHLETLPSNLHVTYTEATFPIDAPVVPDPAKYYAPKPIEPKLKKHNLLTEKISFLGKRVDLSNQRATEQYEKEVDQWETQQKDLDEQFAKARQEYTYAFADWQSQKTLFDQQEAAIKAYLDSGVPDESAMQALLEKHMGENEWPLETNVCFEIRANGTQIWLDVDLPEFEMMPSKLGHVNSTQCTITMKDISKSQQQKNYLTHIHALGFRMIGETFAVLPTVCQVILSAYSQRPNRTTGRIENQYLYSVTVQRSQWEKIDFDNLAGVDVVEAFSLFNLRRQISKQGVITPIEPFELEK